MSLIVNRTKPRTDEWQTLEQFARESGLLSGDSDIDALKRDYLACNEIWPQGQSPLTELFRNYLKRLSIYGANSYYQIAAHEKAEVALQLVERLANPYFEIREDIAKDASRWGRAIETMLTRIAVLGLAQYDVLAPETRRWMQHEQNELMRERASQGWSSAAFFCPTRAFRSQFGDLPEALAREGISVLYLYSERHGDAWESESNAFYVGGADYLFEPLSFIDVFVTPCIMNCLPTASTKVLIDHLSFAVFEPDSFLSTSTNQEASAGDDIESILRKHTLAKAWLPLYDYIVSSSTVLTENWSRRAEFFGMRRNGVATAVAAEPEAIKIMAHLKDKLRANRHCIIPAGYPKLDTSIDYVAHSPNVERIITYAPTPNDRYRNKEAWAPYMSINTHGEAIVTALARAFPDFTIVFKPYADEYEEVVERIVVAGNQFPNFVWDKSGSGYMSLYAKTRILVSDFSSTAYTYAFSTLRPVVFFSPNEKKLREILNAGHQDDYCEHREKIGRIVDNCDELIDAINGMLSDERGYSETIRATRAELFYHPGASVAYLADSWRKIVANEAAEDWICYSNEPDEVMN